MKSEDYLDKEVTIRSTGTKGKIKRLVPKRSVGGMSYRFIVEDHSGKEHELMPHEIHHNHEKNPDHHQTGAAIQ